MSERKAELARLEAEYKALRRRLVGPGRPTVDRAAYRVLYLAWRQYRRNHPNKGDDQAVADFCRTRVALLKRLGIKVGQGRTQADWDTFRKPLKHGDRSGWVRLATYDHELDRWKLIFQPRAEYEMEQYLEAGRRAALLGQGSFGLAAHLLGN
jgi:hypothetical protein